MGYYKKILAITKEKLLTQSKDVVRGELFKFHDKLVKQYSNTTEYNTQTKIIDNICQEILLGIGKFSILSKDKNVL